MAVLNLRNRLGIGARSGPNSGCSCRYPCRPAGWLAFVSGDVAVFATRERKLKGKAS